MSKWTYITASIPVETFIHDKDIKKIVEEQLSKAPKITGSEEDAEIIVNVKNGYNIVNLSDGLSNQRFQSKVIITIDGELRDRTIAQTRKEFEDFISYIMVYCDYYVENLSVNIKD